MTTAVSSSESATGSRLLSASLSSVSSLMALQLFSRLFTFALNQALFRLASPTAFGAAAIQLELLLSTILFLSREGVRNALLRAPQTTDSTQGDTSAKIRRRNLSFIPLVLGVPLALTAAIGYERWAGDEIKAQPHFQLTVAIYAVAAVAELCSEPLYNVAMGDLLTWVRVRAEGLGITAKSIATFLVLYYNSTDLALVAFAVGQLMYSLVMFATYVSYFGFAPLQPKKTSASSSGLLSQVDRDALSLSFTMTLQSLVKHVLTEGDKVVLSWFSPLRDQGGYAIAVNYGSLIARIVFQPIEETLRLFFSRTLGEGAQDMKRASNGSRVAALNQAATTLRGLLTAQTSFSLIFILFGAHYMPVVLPILLPPQYMATSAPKVLEAWLFYIPVLAVNGALEAFLSSVATTKDLNKQSRWMIVFSTVYILSAIALYRAGFGESSLVYANIINLSVRIAYCFLFVQKYFATPSQPQSQFSSKAQRNEASTSASPAGSSHPPLQFRQILPPSALIYACFISGYLVKLSKRRFLRLDPSALADMRLAALLQPGVQLHVAVGGVLALGCVGVWWLCDGRAWVRDVKKSKSD